MIHDSPNTDGEAIDNIEHVVMNYEGLPTDAKIRTVFFALNWLAKKHANDEYKLSFIKYFDVEFGSFIHIQKYEVPPENDPQRLREYSHVVKNFYALRDAVVSANCA